jgi:hypothetical protein
MKVKGDWGGRVEGWKDERMEGWKCGMRIAECGMSAERAAQDSLG